LKERAAYPSQQQTVKVFRELIWLISILIRNP